MSFISEQEQITLQRELIDFFGKHYQGVGIETWHLCHLGSFGLQPDKLVFHAKTLSDDFEKNEGRIPVNNIQAYRNWVTITYQKFFCISSDLLIIPDLESPKRLKLFDLETKMSLIIAFNNNNFDTANFVTFHWKDDLDTYKFLMDSGLINDQFILEKVNELANGYVFNQVKRSKKAISKELERRIKASRYKLQRG
jgi:hypothetical protein